MVIRYEVIEGPTWYFSVPNVGIVRTETDSFYICKIKKGSVIFISEIDFKVGQKSLLRKLKLDSRKNREKKTEMVLLCPPVWPLSINILFFCKGLRKKTVNNTKTFFDFISLSSIYKYKFPYFVILFLILGLLFSNIVYYYYLLWKSYYSGTLTVRLYNWNKISIKLTNECFIDVMSVNFFFPLY